MTTSIASKGAHHGNHLPGELGIEPDLGSSKSVGPGFITGSRAITTCCCLPRSWIGNCAWRPEGAKLAPDPDLLVDRLAPPTEGSCRRLDCLRVHRYAAGLHSRRRHWVACQGPALVDELLLALAFFLLANLVVGLAVVGRAHAPELRMLAAQLFGTTSVAILLVLGDALATPAARDVALVFALLAAVAAIAYGRRVLDAKGGEPR